MIMTRKFFFLVTLAARLFAPGLPAAIPPAEQLLPVDTLVVLSAPDWNQWATMVIFKRQAGCR